MAIWISSNCRSPVALLRERFVYKMLESGMEIDVYGECSGQMFPIESRWDPAFHDVISRLKKINYLLVLNGNIYTNQFTMGNIFQIQILLKFRKFNTLP